MCSSDGGDGAKQMQHQKNNKLQNTEENKMGRKHNVYKSVWVFLRNRQVGKQYSHSHLCIINLTAAVIFAGVFFNNVEVF